MLTTLNFLLGPASPASSASLVSLPLHMQMLGALSSTLVLPLLLHWSRIKSLSVCCLLFIVTSILVIFTDISWMFRLSEFLSGFASGLTLPLVHIYSSEVFTPKRRTKFALVITFLHTLGEMIAAVVGYFFTIEVRLFNRNPFRLKRSNTLGWSLVKPCSVCAMFGVRLVLCSGFS